MPIIIWNDNYSVNIKEIDNQHKILIGMINELHDGMKAGKGKEVMSKVLFDLVDYTVTHFDTEENLFDKYAYPETSAHKKQHTDLVEQVASIQKKYHSGETVLTMDILNFLRDWLNDHIIGSDKRYAVYLNGKGVK